MRWIASVLVVLALVAGLWWMWQQRQGELTPERDAGIPAESVQPQPRHPLPQPEVHRAPATEEGAAVDPEAGLQAQPAAESEPPLPDLAESDDVALATLSDLLGADFTQQWVKPEFVVPRTVAVISSLDGQAPAMKTRPLRPLEFELHTEEIEGKEALLWTEANAERYDALIQTLASVSPRRAAALYGRYYPLFQQAWEELGETEPYFNDRLIDIIDHLLATPEAQLPFEVVPHEGRLHFADESLQQASWGRKILIRMGPAHAGQVKEWLRQFRNAATENATQSAG